MEQLKMNVAARIAVLMNLPNKGSIVDMLNARNIRNKISFSSKEFEELNLKDVDGNITWSPSDMNKDVEFSSTEIKFLRKIVDELSNSTLITENLIDFADNVIKISDNLTNYEDHE